MGWFSTDAAKADNSAAQSEAKSHYSNVKDTGQIKKNLRGQNASYDKAVGQTEKAIDARDNVANSDSYQDAQNDYSNSVAHTQAAKHDLKKAENENAIHKKNAERLNDKNETLTEKQEEQTALINSNKEKQEELRKQRDSATSDEERDAYNKEINTLEDQNFKAAEKNEALGKQKEQNNKKIEAEKKSLKSDEELGELEKKIETEEAELEKKKEAKEAEDKKLAEAEQGVADAKEHEEEVKEEQAEKFPSSFGEEVKAADAKEKAIKEAKAKEIRDKKKEERKQQLNAKKSEAKSSTCPSDDPAKKATCEQKIDNAQSESEVNRIVAEQKAQQAKEKLDSDIADKEDSISHLHGQEANDAIKELEAMKAARKAMDQVAQDPNAGMNNLLANLLLHKSQKKNAYLYFDAPPIAGVGVGLGGRLEDLIEKHLQPIYKHAFMGQFPEGLKDLDWLVRTMDRPKVDIEYVEQIRNNVKRQYPIKYSFGDLSMTFHDDVYHKTIKTITHFFETQIWEHESIKAGGTFLLRDSVVIDEIIVWDLTVENQPNLKYTFQNVSLLSFDYDAPDEAEDSGIHTIQVTFKIEGFKVEEAMMPRVLNIANDLVWLPYLASGDASEHLSSQAQTMEESINKLNQMAGG